jgi:hypothetical protein
VRNRECLRCSPWSRRIYEIEEFVLCGRRDLQRERERERAFAFLEPVSKASSCHFYVLPSVSLSNNIPVSHFQISS